MKNDNALKKHHFWILLGLVPLLTLIGVVVVQGSVGGAITARQSKISSTESTIAGKLNTKSKKTLEAAEKHFIEVSKKQGDMHKVNWERQKHLYTWPTRSPLLKEIEAKGLKFGDPLPNERGEFNEFQKTEIYLGEFSSLKKDGSGGPGTGMADRVAPTQFFGGDWRKVLRHVNDFGQVNITKDQIWLIMEDIWVQRSMLSAISAVNQETSMFRRAKLEKGEVVEDPTFDENGNKIDRNKNRIPTPAEEKKKALFRNRTWAVELELVPEGDSKRLTGTLTNLTDRLQLMGLNDMMTLHVWFTRQPTEQPTVFKIGGPYLRGKGATKRGPDGREVPDNVITIVPTPDHLLAPGKIADEIVRIEHVFDIRTVPIKRIDHLVIGHKRALDSRNAEAVLVGPPSPPFTKEKEPDAGTGTDPGTGIGTPMPGTGSSAGPPPGTGSSAGPPPLTGAGTGGGIFPGGMGGGTSAKGGTPEGGGSITDVIDGNKKRYLEVTAQVRRMPVAIVVVVDQSYVQDVLLAFANSPLRFQITQVTWRRFSGTLTGAGATGPGGNSSGDIESRGGYNNITGGSDPDARGGSSLGPPPMPGGMGSSIGPPPMPGGVGPGRPVGPGVPDPTGGAGSLIASESQITAGLVELSIYGIVSLYEKYSDTPPPPTTPDPKDTKTPDPKDTKTPDPKAPTTPEPKDTKSPDPKDSKAPVTPDPKTPKNPDPKMPMTPDPKDSKTPKMRRRVRP